MPIKNESPKRFMDEVRIISQWAYVVAAVGFGGGRGGGDIRRTHGQKRRCFFS